MKKLLLVVLLGLTGIVFADTWVDGYYRKDGTYVPGHYRSDRNNDIHDNWTYKDNVNPWTGEKGTKDDDDYKKKDIFKHKSIFDNN